MYMGLRPYGSVSATGNTPCSISTAGIGAGAIFGDMACCACGCWLWLLRHVVSAARGLVSVGPF